MPSPRLLLDEFPVEIIFDVWTYLTAFEILHSFHNFSRYLRECIRSYERYRVNFTSVRKKDFERLCRLIRPEQILALTLSDDEETPGQMAAFFARFPTFEQTFSRLECLHVRNIDAFRPLSPMKSLHTLTIDFVRWPIYYVEYGQIQAFDEKLASLFRLPTVRTLELNREALNTRFNVQQLPCGDQLQRFAVHLRTIDNLPLIFTCVPHVQRLSISLNSTSVDDDLSSRLHLPRSLTHLTVRVSCGRRDDLELLLRSSTHLISLNVHIEQNQLDTQQWLDGDWWQSAVEEHSPQLKIFRLRIDLSCSVDWNATRDFLRSFQSSFWSNDDEGRRRSFTVGVMSFSPLLLECKQQLIPRQALTITWPTEASVSERQMQLSHVETLTVETTLTDDALNTVTSVTQLQRELNGFSALAHLKLNDTCAMSSSVLAELLSRAPHLIRLSVTSFDNQLHRLFDRTYPQIRWLDLRRSYLPSSFVRRFCSVFTSLEHLLNCFLANEEDFPVLTKHLRLLHNFTGHLHSYYFDSDDEFQQWLTTHTRLKNFTFKLVDERQIFLWIDN